MCRRIFPRVMKDLSNYLRDVDEHIAAASAGSSSTEPLPAAPPPPPKALMQPAYHAETQPEFQGVFLSMEEMENIGVDVKDVPDAPPFDQEMQLRYARASIKLLSEVGLRPTCLGAS